MEVYAAFKSVPDYYAGSPPLVSLHKTLDGAVKALYPDNEDFQNSFRAWTSSITGPTWEGPDGFGLIRLLEVKE